jgi:hypothetical protein
VNIQERPAKPLDIQWMQREKDGTKRTSHLQNLSNYSASKPYDLHSTHMMITKRARVVFYALATMEMLLLSALYAWGHAVR